MASTVRADPVPGILARSRDVGAVSEVAAALVEADAASSCAWHRGDDLAVLRATGDPDLLSERVRSLPDVAIHRTTSRRLRRHRMTWDPGRPTPGVGIIFDIRRNAALDRPAFDAHWRDVHGPLALAHHIGMWDYEQVTVVGGDTAGLDGFAIVQFPTVEDASERFFDTRDGAAIVSADAAAFTDAATLTRTSTTEYVMLEPPPPDVGVLDWADHRSLPIDAPPDRVWDMAETAADAAMSVRHRRPDARMIEFDVETTTAHVLGATCRWEVRAEGPSTRLEWSVRASVGAGSEVSFAAFADRLWLDVEVDAGRIA